MTRITYLDINFGRAEPTRLAMVISGQEFEDRRISFQEFEKIKDEAPWKTLPYMETDGFASGQSIAMLRYVAKKGNLYPDDPLEALKVDEIVMVGEDFNINLFSTMSLEGEQQKMKREELASGKLKMWLEKLSDMLAENKSSPYFVGKSITAADLQIYQVVTLLESGFINHVPTSIVKDCAPSLHQLKEEINNLDEVKKYHAARSA